MRPDRQTPTTSKTGSVLSTRGSARGSAGLGTHRSWRDETAARCSPSRINDYSTQARQLRAKVKGRVTCATRPGRGGYGCAGGVAAAMRRRRGARGGRFADGSGLSEVPSRWPRSGRAGGATLEGSDVEVTGFCELGGGRPEVWHRLGAIVAPLLRLLSCHGANRRSASVFSSSSAQSRRQGYQSTTVAIASISINAPLGKPAAWTVARAGGFSAK